MGMVMQKTGTGSHLVSLDDKWTVKRGRVLLNGTQALARVMLAQHELDIEAGLNTAGYITGYRGSPLGNVDTTLWSIADRLKAAKIKFLPGVNEDLAATAVRGTQQIDAVPDPLHDGVFAAWYGKGPGIDRSGDALKHGNYLGVHRNGGVAVFYGDDHGGKSSTVAHHSEQAMAAAMIPSLYPADVGEVLRYGLLAFALSRYSGSWVGIKLVNEVAEQTATADIDLVGFAPVLPSPSSLPPEGVHVRNGPYGPLRDEQIVREYRLPLVQAFVRANAIDTTIFRAPSERIGLVTCGKSYGDTRQALELLGLDPERAAALGISLYKVGCIWPLERTGLAAFAGRHEVLFVVEEKESFVEAQIAAAIVNMPERPMLIGKQDEEGLELLPSVVQLDPVAIAAAIAGRLERLGIRDAGVTAALAALGRGETAAPGMAALPKRSPYFCSGCPHNRSTRVPAGSLSMTGIGCHTMVNFVRPAEALPPAHMGAEGTNWIGLAPFTGTRHIFQNMGDGTYYHSGLLAIRAAVASGVNITYKILYNDAVAMTGGQPVDGPISVMEIVQQVRHEGVRAVVIVSDHPEAYRNDRALPADVRVEHRDRLDDVQRSLREVEGCSVLIYEQTCAAEKRRRRKRGTFPDEPKRLFISPEICEGCGDCSMQSTCVSLLPLETELGTKRRLDQSSCNKDYSCLEGFCPSFVTVRHAGLRKPVATVLPDDLFATMPPPTRAPLGSRTFNLIVAGIGGTGVVTVAGILGMAAHLEGLSTSLFDMTGLAQKNGAVFSHMRIAAAPEGIHAQRLSAGEADVLIAFDLVAASANEAMTTLAADRTRAIVNTDVSVTSTFQFDREAKVDGRLLLSRLSARLRDDAVLPVPANELAMSILGDSIAANMFLVGVAAQSGLLPVGVAAIEQAVTLNGTAVSLNLTALRLGRLYATDRESVVALMPSRPENAKSGPVTLKALIERWSKHLVEYQDQALAVQYRALIDRVIASEQRVAPGSEALSRVVAVNYARVLAYKDEYEVARLLSSSSLRAQLAETFADGGILSFNLAPPLLGGRKRNGRPVKREFRVDRWLPMFRVLAKAKRLRGTWLDPFSYTVERRREKALAADYARLVTDTIELLTPATHASAQKLLGFAGTIRGYGPVKEKAMRDYSEALPAYIDACRSPTGGETPASAERPGADAMV